MLVDVALVESHHVAVHVGELVHFLFEIIEASEDVAEAEGGQLLVHVGHHLIGHLVKVCEHVVLLGG